MHWLQSLLTVFYIVLPAATAVAAAMTARRQKSWRPIASVLITFASGLVLGVVACLFYARAVDATVPVSQLLVTAYLASAVLLILKSISWLLKEGLDRALWLSGPRSTGRPRGASWVARATLAIVARSLILFAVGIPYFLGLALVYRPRTVEAAADPVAVLPDAKIEAVSFPTADGLTLSGWWIPARPPVAGQTDPAWGQRTVVLCHGLGATKSTYLTLARDLWPHGYNVLSFDFRAHGQSDGQICSFGDRERQDVLAAVHWARSAHPENCRQVYGIGVDIGAAALLAAASEDDADARAIQAVALIGAFDRLTPLIDRPIDTYFAAPIAWLARHVALPIASAHAGTRLSAFAPIDLVDNLAPRPLLVVHARGDSLVPFDAGYRLFDRASVPRYRYWVGELAEDGQWVIRANPKVHVDDQEVPHTLAPEGVSADQHNILSSEDTVRAIRAVFELGKQMV